MPAENSNKYKKQQYPYELTAGAKTNMTFEEENMKILPRNQNRPLIVGSYITCVYDDKISLWGPVHTALILTSADKSLNHIV